MRYYLIMTTFGAHYVMGRTIATTRAAAQRLYGQDYHCVIRIAKREARFLKGA